MTQGAAPGTGIRVVMHEAETSCWWEFLEPVEVISTHMTGDVVPLLERLEARVERERLFAAGFVSYEAAPAFDPACTVHPAGDFPLIWFGLFRTRSAVSLSTHNLPAPPSLSLSPSIDERAYTGALARIRTLIHDGETYQVNFTFRLQAGFHADPWDSFRHMVRAQNPRYGAFIDTGRWTVCSASPELFFVRSGHRLVSTPMKGTGARAYSDAEDCERGASLQASEKNRAENLMIVDMVRNDMGRIADPGTVRVPEIFAVERFPTLWQMTSTVECRTSAGFTDILRALFPAASITGAPKIRTMEIIRGLEKEPRRIYTGTIGFLSPDGGAQCNVAIRTLLVDRDRGTAEYGTGSGVVWDSETRSEYAECLLKADILTHQEPAFDLLETMAWVPQEGFPLLDLHLERLASSAAYFGRACPTTKIAALLHEAARGFPPRAAKVRLTLPPSGEAVITVLPFPAVPFPVIPLARKPLTRENVFLYHKTTNRSVYEEALRDAPGADDVLLWNTEGEITESTRANVVMELEGVLVTPPVGCGLLPGVYRSQLLKRGIIRESVIRVGDLERCTRVYLINAVRGMWEITRVGR
jgi:para-aminobenzoate synthetase / 4-amino-4-deoxychorismate lyase